MKVAFQRITEITTGAVRIEEKSDGIHFYRFTTEQEELYRQTNEDYFKRTFTTAGVRLCFQTTSRILMLRVFTRMCLTRQFFSFDVFVNDHCVGGINNFTEHELPIDYTTSSFPMGSFEKTFELGDGIKTVDVFFPWSVEAVLQSMELDDNCLINPVKPNKRLLMFGDSITQGYDTLFPSKHYSVKLSKLLDAEIINKAIGGEVFFPALANTRERFRPDYITVAYGTNDWSKKNREDLLENARKFYSTLQQAYPDAQIFAMLPIWRKDRDESRPYGSFDLMRRDLAAIIREQGIEPIDCYDYIPKDSLFFSDMRLHPNEMGFTHYSNNLCKIITSRLVKENHTMETRPYVAWDLINSFMIDVFKAYGVPEEDAKICADVLLESDRRGIESHGCNRFKPIYLDRIKNGTLLPVTECEIVKEGPCTVLMDAHNGMGMVASYKMMEMLIEKAKVYGVACGSIYNSTHYGIAGYWSTMAEKAGMIGITGTNARPSAAPTFGVEPMMGTNPLTFTMPTDEEFPFNFDCATTIVQNGKIEYYARSGKETPAGLVVTKDGGTMTNSAEILSEMRKGNCSLLSIGGIGEETGGFKGYGFTTIVEILSAALAGGPHTKALTGKDENGNNAFYRLGHFFIVINPEFFAGLDVFKSTTGDILRALRGSTKAPGAERIYTAGEKEHLAWVEREPLGVPVGDAIQKEFIQLRDECGLDYKFPFEA